MNALSTRTSAGATITARAPTKRLALRVAEPGGVGIALGVPLPDRIGLRTISGGRSALCLGPDEWLIEAPEAEGGPLAASLADLAGRTAISVVDVSDREITYVLEGPAVLDLLATGCPRDLAKMEVGSGARTVFDTAQVVLTREAVDRFHLTVWRSFAPHVRALLDIAVREFATGF